MSQTYRTENTHTTVLMCVFPSLPNDYYYYHFFLSLILISVFSEWGQGVFLCLFCLLFVNF